MVWLLDRAGKADSRLPAPPDITFRPDEENFRLVQKWGDALALAAANNSWSGKLTQSILAALAGASADFGGGVPQPVAARRAERLVLALDRLLAAQKDSAADTALNRLFQLAQSVPDFDAKQFAAALDEFSSAVAAR